MQTGRKQVVSARKVDWRKATCLNGPEESPGFLLWRVSSEWRREIEATLAPFNITHPQFVLLAALGWLTRKGARVSQVELARFSASDPTMTSQILRTLEKRGLIQRERMEGNERSKFPSLTAQGAKKIEEVLPLVEEVDHHFFSRLGKRLKSCISLLRDLSG